MLADLHDLDKFRWIRVEIDHVARFLGGLRAGVHGHAHVCLSKCRGVVRAVAGHGNELAFGLLALDECHFVFRLGFGEKVVYASLSRDRCRGERVVAGNHHGANAHRAQMLEPLAHAAFDDVR